MAKINIVTDSVADIPAELIEKSGITVIPTYVNYDGKSFADDGIELIRDEFYKSLPTMTMLPTTAAPAPGMAGEILKEAIDGADHVVAIHVPEKLSATLNAVRLGAESQELSPDKITIVDSQTLSMGMGYQALVAAETAAETGDVQRVVEDIARARNHTQVYCAFATMEYLRRSGRVNSVVAGVGSLLKIKPIVRVWDGEVLPHARVRTFNKALQKLNELVVEQAPLDRLTILHIRNEEDAHRLMDMLGDVVPEETLIVEAGPTLGTHIGPGAVGAITLTKKWRQ